VRFLRATREARKRLSTEGRAKACGCELAFAERGAAGGERGEEGRMGRRGDGRRGEERRGRATAGGATERIKVGVVQGSVRGRPAEKKSSRVSR